MTAVQERLEKLRTLVLLCGMLALTGAGPLCAQEGAASRRKPALAPTDKDFLLVLARKTINEAVSNREATEPALKPSDEEKGKESDKSLNPVVGVSLFAQGRLMQFAVGQMDSLANATRKAAWRVGESIRRFEDAATALKQGRILVEVVGEKSRIQVLTPREAVRGVNMGVEGIEVSLQGQGGYVTPVAMLLSSMSGQTETIIAQLYSMARLSPTVKAPTDIQLLKFTTTAFIESEPGGFPVDVYRGNVLEDKADPEDLETAAFAAGRWLIKMQDKAGKFLYWFNPITQVQEMRYDMLHHAGACLALLDLYEATHDEAFVQAFKRGREYLMRSMRQVTRGGRKVAYVEVANDASVGVAALTLLTFAEWSRISGERPEAQIMDDLGAFIVQMQAENGGFYRLLSQADKKTLTQEEQPFYAGQAIYALCRANKIVPHDEWVEVAVRGASCQIAEFDKTKNADPWVMRAFAELYGITQDEGLGQDGLRMADAILSKQLRPGSVPDLDFIGGFNDVNPPRTVSAARFVQGLCIAYNLAKKLRKPADRYREGIELGAKFVVQQQIRPQNAFFIADPPQTMGGFHQGPLAFDMRIDYTQHSILACKAAADVLRAK